MIILRLVIAKALHLLHRMRNQVRVLATTTALQYYLIHILWVSENKLKRCVGDLLVWTIKMMIHNFRIILWRFS